MKCYTVTENGVRPGIEVMPEPYPHVGVGDPAVTYDYRRVAVDEALGANGPLASCSYVIDRDEGDTRATSYKLVPASGVDDDQALVLLVAHCAPNGRTFYDFPRYTFTLANGWYSAGPRVRTPANLIVMKKGYTVRVDKIEDLTQRPERVFSIAFDGSELRLAD